jgi:hypothetical protein
MFGRQNVGTINPFQQFGAINPFQPAATLSARCPACGAPVSQFQHPVGGVSPFSTGAAGLGGINPLLAQAALYSANPFATTQGLSGQISPFASQQQGGAVNPLLLSQLYQQAGGSEFGGQVGGGISGQWPGASIPGAGVYGQQAGGGVNPHILSQLLANPAKASDPVAGALIAQQLHASTVQQPPIRSLISPLQSQPFQTGSPVGLGSIVGQGLDPSTAFIQAQLMSQLAANPFQQMLRPYANVPWGIGGGLSPFAGQVSPFGQTGLPFNF